jgi:hypothetical protein
MKRIVLGLFIAGAVVSTTGCMHGHACGRAAAQQGAPAPTPPPATPGAQ